MSLGDRLRQRRQRRHLTQEELAAALGVSSRTVIRWEQNLAIPRSNVRQQLCRLLEMDLADFVESPLPAPLWTVPFGQNPCFTGREAILDRLHTHLKAKKRPIALTQAAALSGLGGIGKTQMAIEYAYRYAQRYSAVFWLAAETSENLMRSLQQIADVLQLPEREAAEQERMVKAVQQWLVTHADWLLIADNVEDLDLLQTILPPTRPGTLLLTTRRQALGTLAEPVELSPMGLEEGITLLLRRARLLSMTGSTIPEEMRTTPILAEARQLVTQLEGLPLALDQAGAYIEETGCSVADFLQRYRDQRQRVLAHRGLHQGEHPDSVAVTLQLSVEHVAERQPAAEDLLQVCAFLHAEAIPEELFREGASHLGPVLGAVATDAYLFDQVLAALRSVSLVTRSPETRTLSVHRLVQAVLQDRMDAAETCLWSERVVCMVNAVFPDGTIDTWEQCERYLAHVLACVPLMQRTAGNQPEAGELLSKAGTYLMARGRYKEAEPLLGLALTLGEQQPDLDHTVMITRLNKQAELFWHQGKHVLAEELLQRQRRLEEQHLGQDHPDTASTLNSLALLSFLQGNYEEAESLYQRALSIHEQRLGQDHPETAVTLSNLALLYKSQGKYEAAGMTYRRVLRVREQQLGQEHPETAHTLGSLASVYSDQGKYEAAEMIYQRVLRMQEQQLGREHPDVAYTLNNLAVVYRDQEKYKVAEALLQRALEIRERQLGHNHHLVANTLHNLAAVYKAQGKDEKAEPLFRRTLDMQEQQLGPDHPTLAHALTSLANLYRDQGRDEEAEPLFQRALSMRERHLGPAHPFLAETLAGLANMYRDQERYEEAEPLFQRALNISEQRLGATHPKTRKIRAGYQRSLARSVLKTLN